MKSCVLALTREGRALAETIAQGLPHCDYLFLDGPISSHIAGAWTKYHGIICVMATGIVVRALAPLVTDKRSDPCVVVLDQKGLFAISLLSGHLGGGNRLAVEVANITGGRAVITTASDVAGRTPLDLWAKRHKLYIADRALLTRKSAKLVDSGSLLVYGLPQNTLLPSDLVPTDLIEEADLIIGCHRVNVPSALSCIPRHLFLGVGCNRGTPAADIESAFAELCARHRLQGEAFAGVASIDVKSDEEGILDFADGLGLPLFFYGRDALNGVVEASSSAAVMKAVGAKGVAEPAALLAARRQGHDAKLLIAKEKWKDVTLAVAHQVRERWE